MELREQALDPRRRGEVRRVVREQRRADGARRAARPGSARRPAWASATAMRPTGAASRCSRSCSPTSASTTAATASTGARRDVPRARFTPDEVVTADARLLPSQLHRRPVPLLRHHPLARLHDGAARARREDAARGARLPRLHPSEDDSRRRSAPDRRGGALRGSALGQHRDADGGRALRARAGEDRARRSSSRWATSACAARRAKAEPRAPRYAPAGPEHADDRRRRRDQRCDDPVDRGDALRVVRAAPRLLLGVQPDPARVVAAARARRRRCCASTGSTRRTGCCATTASRASELAAGERRHARPRDRSRSSRGRSRIASAFPSTSTARTGRRCCACRASACAT